MRVAGVRRLKGDFTVYDIQLETENTFLAEGVVTHNSEICQVNDGREYTPEEAEGVLPAHPGCRSVMITIWKGQGRPDDDDYFDWLRKQPNTVQNEVLGVTKAKLFRDGGLEGKDLIRASTGEPYTLNQLRSREAEAFESAGVE